MTTLVLPIVVTVIAFILIIYAYSGIRRGGARVYTLEREAILRRATAAMFGASSLFILTVAWLLYLDQTAPVTLATPVATSAIQTPGDGQDDLPNANAVQPIDATIQIPSLETVTLTPTIDPNVPTATPTAIVVRGFVTGTGGNGLTLRDTPGGEEMAILGEDEFVTIIESEGSVELNGFTWIKVRTFLGDEGWVAQDFLEIERR